LNTCCWCKRLPDSSRYNTPKRGKYTKWHHYMQVCMPEGHNIYQIAITYVHLPNVHNIYQMVITYVHIPNCHNICTYTKLP
jgi:coproporphyrinogen III oxidase-like Fe-S oxidoreductase